MCLLLYMAAHDGVPLHASGDIRVEEVEAERAAIRQWFSLPEVRFIGAHTGCSCGFPHIVSLRRETFFLNEQFFYRVTVSGD